MIRSTGFRQYKHSGRAYRYAFQENTSAEERDNYIFGGKYHAEKIRQRILSLYLVRKFKRNKR